MKKIFLYLCAAGIIAFSFADCTKNIDTTPPSALDAAQGFKTASDVNAALLGCYSALQSGNYMGLRYFAFADMYADNLIWTGTFPSFAEIFNKNILANNVELQNMWAIMYSGINRCNNVIASAPSVTSAGFNANNAVGEARCLRAYHYFNLLRYWGGSTTGYNKSGGLGVPLITKPTLSIADTASVARSSEADVWALILDDLDFAVKNLATDNGTGRVNLNVAKALKARAHLYKAEWATAESLASEVIGVSKYSLVSGASYSDMYLKKNTAESIWELQFDPTNSNSIAFFYYPTTLGGRNEIQTSDSLKAVIETGDVRLPIDYTTSPKAKTLKYTRIAGDDNVILVRLAEMYLIRSEARAQQSKAGAIGDLNKIRTRAGLTALTDSSTSTLIKAIEKERRVEFAHEGHRWFDIRRYNDLGAVGITALTKTLWPIPQREVQTSGGVIVQNDGY